MPYRIRLCEKNFVFRKYIFTLRAGYRAVDQHLVVRPPVKPDPSLTILPSPPNPLSHSVGERGSRCRREYGHVSDPFLLPLSPTEWERGLGREGKPVKPIATIFGVSPVDAQQNVAIPPNTPE